MVFFLITIALPIICLLVLQFYIMYKSSKTKQEKTNIKQINRIICSINKTDKKIFYDFINHSKMFNLIKNIKDQKYIG